MSTAGIPPIRRAAAGYGPLSNRATQTGAGGRGGVQVDLEEEPLLRAVLIGHTQLFTHNTH